VLAPRLLKSSLAARREGRPMIVPPSNVRVLIATKPVDFRKAAIVETEFKADPFSVVIYVFRSKRAGRKNAVLAFLQWKHYANVGAIAVPISLFTAPYYARSSKLESGQNEEMKPGWIIALAQIAIWIGAEVMM
jgi:hypothetical protein